MSNGMQLTARVLTPEETVFEGEVKSVSSFNNKGEFSILPNHANFISVIFKKIIIQDVSGSKKEIKVDEKGVILCRNNKIEVYL